MGSISNPGGTGTAANTYNGTAVYGASKAAYATTQTDSNGKAVFSLVKDDGSAIFESIWMDSIQLLSYSTDRTLIFSNPVVSADQKTITVDVRMNASLLALGLLPFTAAAANYVVKLRCAGT